MENTKKLMLSTLFFFALALPMSGGLFVNPLVQAQEEEAQTANAQAQLGRPLSRSTARALEPVRQALAPQPATEGAPESEPNPELALQELQRINIDQLPSHEKAEVYFLYGYTYYLLEDTDQAIAYWRRVINEPEANTPLATRTRERLEQMLNVE